MEGGAASPPIRIAVVMVSYNEAPQAVVEALRSLLRQDHPIDEIAFVDDGSEDMAAYQAVRLSLRRDPLRFYALGTLRSTGWGRRQGGTGGGAHGDGGMNVAAAAPGEGLGA